MNATIPAAECTCAELIRRRRYIRGCSRICKNLLRRARAQWTMGEINSILLINAFARPRKKRRHYVVFLARSRPISLVLSIFSSPRRDRSLWRQKRTSLGDNERPLCGRACSFQAADSASRHLAGRLTCRSSRLGAGVLQRTRSARRLAVFGRSSAVTSFVSLSLLSIWVLAPTRSALVVVVTAADGRDLSPPTGSS